jgi:hypothetical protein
MLINNYGLSWYLSPGVGPRPDKASVCNLLLAEIDKEATPSEPMLRIRSTIIEYMQRDLGITFSFALAQNYPNPFNPSTTIHFTLPHRIERVQLAIFDVTGKEVWSTTLGDMPTGDHEVVWDGNTSGGVPASSGIYFYRVSADKFFAAKRMLLIK